MVRSTGPRAPSPTIAQIKLIVLAFAMGIVLFATVAAVVGPAGEPPEGGAAEDAAASLGSMLEYVLIAFGAVVIVAAPFVRSAVFKRVASRRDEALAEIADGHVPTELAAGIIVSAAIVESFGLFGCVIVLMTGNLVVLLAPAISVFLIVLGLPSEQSLRESVESAGRLA